VRKDITIQPDPKRIFKDLGELLPIHYSGTKSEKEKIDKKLTETSQKAMYALGLDNHYPLSQTTHEAFQPLVIETTRQIEKEYKCITASDKILAELIGGAHVRIISYSTLLNACWHMKYLSSEKVAYYSMISKEIDRAHRQLTTALITLKQLKTPSLNVNIKTNTAFIGDKQQFNVNKKTDESK